ncbi:B-box zinc finger protein 20-like [Rutidosis leptorrhynchoides]|uniref:B-box zinc finger protein 20-like n=1 Tax=Rutidosis leptorrhynchoides TaxID=125765 RepID=UPI003A98D5FF
MKIWCDVCDKEEASLFCSADEAALCDGCDQQIHIANKLSRNHSRFTLLQPNSIPLCDICQERRAFLFCQEDKAILCRECDFPIHNGNEHTRNHNRFLLTGIKLSALSSPNLAESCINANKKINSSQSSPRKKSRTDVSDEIFSSHSVTTPSPASTSSFSEYLMETLPGWRVDEFLDPATIPNGFCKTGDCFSVSGDDQDLPQSTSSFTNHKQSNISAFNSIGNYTPLSAFNPSPHYFTVPQGKERKQISINLCLTSKLHTGKLMKELLHIMENTHRSMITPLGYKSLSELHCFYKEAKATSLCKK